MLSTNELLKPEVFFLVRNFAARQELDGVVKI